MRIPRLLFAAAAVLAVSCTRSSPPAAQGTKPAVDAAVTQQIRDAGQARVRALESGDVEGYLSAYKDDAVWIPPNAPNVMGKEHARMRVKALIEKFTVEEVAESEEMNFLSADAAIERGRYSLMITAKEGGETQQEVGSFLTTWQKQPDGKWRIVYDIWNPSRPSAPINVNK
jgi:uncharacterized protein (TIGR02246 family)